MPQLSSTYAALVITQSIVVYAHTHTHVHTEKHIYISSFKCDFHAHETTRNHSVYQCIRAYTYSIERNRIRLGWTPCVSRKTSRAQLYGTGHSNVEDFVCVCLYVYVIVSVVYEQERSAPDFVCVWKIYAPYSRTNRSQHTHTNAKPAAHSALWFRFTNTHTNNVKISTYIIHPPAPHPLSPDPHTKRDCGFATVAGWCSTLHGSTSGQNVCTANTLQIYHTHTEKKRKRWWFPDPFLMRAGLSFHRWKLLVVGRCDKRQTQTNVGTHKTHIHTHTNAHIKL